MRTLVGLALNDAWTPCTDFLLAARTAADVPTAEGAVPLWRSLREVVLGALDEAGLHASVERVDALVPLDEHSADLAGLVRVHADPDPDERPARPAASRGPVFDARRTAIGLDLGLTLHDGIPVHGVRAFLGQYRALPFEHGPCPALRWLSPDVPCWRRTGLTQVRPVELRSADGRSRTCDVAVSSPCDGVPAPLCARATPWRARPAWFDRPLAWRDAAGHPVLTVELHPDVDLLAVAVELDGLPLLVERHPHPQHVDDLLLVLRWDPTGTPPEAEHRPLVPADPGFSTGWVRA